MRGMGTRVQLFNVQFPLNPADPISRALAGPNARSVVLEARAKANLDNRTVLGVTECEVRRRGRGRDTVGAAAAFLSRGTTAPRSHVSPVARGSGKLKLFAYFWCCLCVYALVPMQRKPPTPSLSLH